MFSAVTVHTDSSVVIIYLVYDGQYLSHHCGTSFGFVKLTMSRI
jgi:hypothetical protein